MTQVLKRNGTTQPWSPDKIAIAVNKAAKRTSTALSSEHIIMVMEAASKALENLDPIPVDQIHIEVENALMDLRLHSVAREYITYRHSHMPDMFRPRATYRPYEYPHYIEYIDAIHQSFWTHNSFNLDSSVQDIRVNMPLHHSTAVIRSILSIASVEAKVKSFWSKLGDRFPKAEFEELGATIGSNEVYHAHFYAKVLDQLALNDLFSEALKTPCMKSRISYMNKSLASKDGDNQDYVKALIFFSLFVENVSLFSQFLTISVFNKELNQVNGLAQGISATQLEEDLHATVGANIIQDLRKEKPLWFTSELEAEVHEMISDAYESELSIIDWIFEEGELDFLPKKVVIEYIKMRSNKGLVMAGFAPYFELDEDLLQQVEWFDIQTKTTIHRDFFSGHSTNYTKNTTSFTEDDLF